jgi:hypothetical protein
MQADPDLDAEVGDGISNGAGAQNQQIWSTGH